MAVAAKEYIGRILGGYRLVALLGAGGAGAVFLGERLDDPSIQRAIKVLLPSEDLSATELSSFQTRFLREAQAASQLRHAHILPILSYHAETSGLSYMELPLMPGGTLAARIADGPLPLDDVASYLRQIASALDYAHRQGVIHRDVKGVNVLLERDGTPLLADFGIARIFERGTTQPLDTTGSRALTRTGQVIGTPSCMAPEQFTGGAITSQLDIYALGVLAWQMVTGALPFTASDPLQLALQHLNTPPPSARALRPELPEPADAALRKALAKRPEDRFESAGTFATAFTDGLSGDWHPVLTAPIATNHALDTTLSELAITPEALEAANGAHADPRTRVATRKLPENQPPAHEEQGNAGTKGRIARAARTGALVMALLVIVIGGVLYAPRILPAVSGFVSPATSTATTQPEPSPTANAFQPLVHVGNTLYATTAPGQCDTHDAEWFTNVEGQQQHCLSGGTVLTGANCPCPLALVKLARLPGGAFPQNYIIQAQIQSIGISRTDYFGFKFREQATTPESVTFGGYGFLVNANGEWEYNIYDSADGHKTTLDRGELPTTLEQPHTYDLIVNGGDFTFAVDGKSIVTKRDTTYSGGILDFAAEPRCVIFISNVALYSLP
ncbi:MAG TPA: serine/threonine-protein kinase [Ktedonobacterales bacterium]